MMMTVAVTPETHRHLPLGGTWNVRDLGGYAVAGGGQTQWRRVLRADALHRLDDAGRGTLVDAGLRTVIDLRFDREVASAPSPFTPDDGVEVLRLPLFERLGLGTDGIPDAPEGDDPLFGLYSVALAKCRPALQQALAAIADAPEGMVLFHCTAGKDRTGLVAAMLLLSVGVDGTTIEEDYALTTRFIAPMFETLLADAQARGDDVERMGRYLGSDAQTMRATLRHLADHHGGIADYLAGGVLDAPRLQRLRDRLVGAA
jgi:protein-tyrosine phosphatase